MSLNLLLIVLQGMQIGIALSQSTSGSPSDYCKFSTNHTMCHYKLQGSSCGDYFKSKKVTEDEKKLILHLHNELRSNLAKGKEKFGKPGPQPPASNMMEMDWDNELQTIAQTHVNQCKFKNNCENCSRVERFEVGQNIYKTFSSFYDDNTDWNIAIRKWYSEVIEFGNSQVMPFIYNSETGHYTQMVWWNTRLIGCGASRFQKNGWWMTHYACNYGPMGNRILSSLYNIGGNCTACPNMTSCSESYEGLCKINKTVTAVGEFWTDKEFYAVADQKYINNMFPEFHKKISSLSHNNLHFSDATIKEKQIPAHVMKYMNFFVNESFPQSFRLAAKMDHSLKEKRTPASISSAVENLDFILSSTGKPYTKV